jgi:hypothetical protein
MEGQDKKRQKVEIDLNRERVIREGKYHLKLGWVREEVLRKWCIENRIEI